MLFRNLLTFVIWSKTVLFLKTGKAWLSCFSVV